MHHHSTSSSLRRLAAIGSLAIAAVAFVLPLPAQAAPNDACGTSVFVNAHTWNPSITADDTGSDTVIRADYTIDFQWTIDWESRTGTVDAQVISGDYFLIGANVWYGIPAPAFEGDPTEGTLPKISSFDYTLSSSSSYLFNNPKLTSLYSIQLVIAQCSESAPTTDPATTEPATTQPATTEPATTEPVTSDAASPTTDAAVSTTLVSRSGGTLPATGARSSAVFAAVLVGAAGFLLIRLARRRPRLG